MTALKWTSVVLYVSLNWIPAEHNQKRAQCVSQNSKYQSHDFELEMFSFAITCGCSFTMKIKMTLQIFITSFGLVLHFPLKEQSQAVRWHFLSGKIISLLFCHKAHSKMSYKLCLYPVWHFAYYLSSCHVINFHKLQKCFHPPPPPK